MAVQPRKVTMFALLEHDIAASADSSRRECEIHWDLLVEEAGRERLPTWRLARNPLETGGEIPAERIKDHRRLYLDYEGEIDGHRGLVRRVDRGPAMIEQIGADELTVRLDGRHLRGRFEISPRAGGRAVFRKVQTSALDRR